MRQPKKRVIFDNYAVDTYFDWARADLIDERPDMEPTDSEIWERAADMERNDWEMIYPQLCEFFAGNSWLAMGTVGRWTGKHAAGTVFESWDEFFQGATKDCDYWAIWDENGHFHFECSHHDGTNRFEIRRLSRRGMEILENWEFDYTDETPEEIVHETLWGCNLFSGLPHFAHTVYGCPKREMEVENA